MLKNQGASSVRGIICDYCNTYYPNKRALTIHEYFHTSEDIDTLLSYSEISKGTYSLPTAQNAQPNGETSMRVTEMNWNKAQPRYPKLNYKITKAFRISEHMDDLLYLTQKYPLRANIKNQDKRYSPYLKRRPEVLDFNKQTSAGKFDIGVNSDIGKKYDETNSVDALSSESEQSKESRTRNTDLIQLKQEKDNELFKSDHYETDIADSDNTSENSSPKKDSGFDPSMKCKSDSMVTSGKNQNGSQRSNECFSETASVINVGEWANLCNVFRENYIDGSSELNEAVKLKLNFDFLKASDGSFEKSTGLTLDTSWHRNSKASTNKNCLVDQNFNRYGQNLTAKICSMPKCF